MLHNRARRASITDHLQHCFVCKLGQHDATTNVTPRRTCADALTQNATKPLVFLKSQVAITYASLTSFSVGKSGITRYGEALTIPKPPIHA